MKRRSNAPPRPNTNYKLIMAVIAVVLLVLVIPISKIAKKSPPKGGAHGNTPTTLNSTIKKHDGAVIRALVAAEETYLNLNQKMNALSEGLLDLRLPGPAAGTENVFSTTVTR